MKRGLAALLLLMGVGMMSANAAAQTTMNVFFTERAMECGQSRMLMELTRREFPQAEWQSEMQADTGRSLRELILADDLPEIVICAPGEAYGWAKEGVFEALDACAGDMAAVNSQVVLACTEDGRLYMAPLTATQRQIAVNRRMLERRRLGYLTSVVDHPVWYPMEFDQLLEEFELAKAPAVEIWKPSPENCAALEALIQAIYGGTMLTEDGRHSQIEHVNVRAGLEWLCERVKSGMIVQVESRQEALDHFLSGKTALFIDWTQEDEQRCARQLRENGIELMTVPYPTATGFTIRSFELTGACIPVGLEGEAHAMAEKAVAFWRTDERAQSVLDGGSIRQDDAVWLPLQDTSEVGTTLRRMMCGIVQEVLAGRNSPAEALRLAQAALDAMN